MNPSQINLNTTMLASAVGKHSVAEENRYVRVAEIKIDSAQLENYKSAPREETEVSVRVEPGVVALHAVAEKDDPSHIVVLEMYADVDAYNAHLETPHFKKYKTVTQPMVRSLKLMDMVAIMLAAKLN